MTARITGWHFDPRDTPAQKRILRTKRIAQVVRRDFPAGTRIRNKDNPEWTGTVFRHVPGMAADGGYLVVDWDKNGVRGRVTLTSQAFEKVT